MSSVRIRFERGEKVKYISHLDLMDVFERAIRRSSIPIAYSQGYNPRPQMVFGLPLSVGVTSSAEYADFQMAEEVDTEKVISEFNRELPQGLKVLEAGIKQTKDNIMASIAASTYDILISSVQKMDSETILGKIVEFLKEEEIIVKKEGKKGVRDVDIRPMIFELKLKDWQGSTEMAEYIKTVSGPGILPPSYNTDNIFCLSSFISAGSVSNLKPELLAQAFINFVGMEAKVIKINRTGLFVNLGGKMTDPLDNGVL